MKKLAILLALAMPSAALAQAGPVGSTGPNGRYVIVHSPHIQGDTVLLDTATGKTWQQVKVSWREGEPVAWRPMSRLDNVAEAADIERNYPEKPATAQK